MLLCINHCLSCVILIYYTVKLCVYIGSKMSRLINVNWLDLLFKRLYIAWSAIYTQMSERGAVMRDGRNVHCM